MTTPAKRRGRPRAYDPDAALAAARDCFWQAGYAATSLEDLAADMGMNRPSIYAAFGDKQALYRATVERYARSTGESVDRVLADPHPLRDTLHTLYRGARDFYLAGEDAPRGCFLIGTAITEARHDPRVREITEATFTGFTRAFTERFERAARDGELTDHPPAALAEIATATLHTLAVRARTGAPPAALDAIIDAAVDLICRP
ncbi:TetR/AcrR family transcriptional regulator [Nocardia sp. BMG111209]|uniref:TetR/AcrR family transcriptional regulator n=1 Tax=Nocardia sp. BMG111209 TaxID=1160137 RepID=UPI00037F3088|nr:TetR/AcrR family transcriptional regulator [Nocardia sp. BMG111209]